MFEFGHNKITDIISNASTLAVNDLLSKIKPHHDHQKQNRYSLRKGWEPSHQKNQNQKSLQQKRCNLFRQLRQIEQQLKYTKVQKKRIQTLKKLQVLSNQQQAYNRASQLISKMNKNRKQQKQSTQKRSQKIYHSIQMQIKKIQAMKIIRQQQQQIKRLRIQDRIQRRHQKFIISHSFQKKSNYLISEIQYYKNLFPSIIQYRNPEEFSTQPLQSGSMEKKYQRSRLVQKLGKKSQGKEQIVNNDENQPLRQSSEGDEFANKLRNRPFFVTD